MRTGYVIFNSAAGNGEFVKNIDMLEVIIEDKLIFIEIECISDYKVFLEGLENDDYIIICGGDGTLNRFINDTRGIKFDNDILYYPVGSGNDFARDMNREKGSDPFSIKKYLGTLPVVTVDSKKYRFINGVGFGIDGYCCEKGDELRKNSKKAVNYTAIAIKGLLFNYFPTDAEITVDDRTYTYKNVWLSPTMFGRFYGGGMIPAPEQCRNNDELSVMVYHSKSKLKALCIFPSIFKGTHIKHEKNVAVHRGKKISVTFNSPRSLQIDGETITGVTSYTAEI